MLPAFLTRAALGDADKAGLQRDVGNRRAGTNKLVGLIRNENNVVVRLPRAAPL
jgi:hypothetical protein